VNKTKIFLADDHALVRSGLKLLLNTQENVEVVGEAGDVPETLRLVPEIKPNLVLLDLSMPGGDPIQTIEQLLAQNPGILVLVVTMHHDRSLMQKTLNAGAAGFVVKSAADSELLDAIQTIIGGKPYVSLGVQDLSSTHLDLQEEKPDPFRVLSAREREVLQLLVRGFTNQAIADQIGVGVKSVESYRARMMAKLGLANRAELVDLALRSGLLN
jgi:two-component system, NarL family, response regulator NreC